MNRRGFLTGIIAAPAVILTPGLLMRVRPVAVPTLAELHALDIERALLLQAAERAVNPPVVIDGFGRYDVAATVKLMEQTNQLLRDMAWVRR